MTDDLAGDPDEIPIRLLNGLITVVFGPWMLYMLGLYKIHGVCSRALLHGKRLVLARAQSRTAA